MYAEATDSQQGAKIKKLIEIPFGENLTVGNPLTHALPYPAPGFSFSPDFPWNPLPVQTCMMVG